MAEASRARHSMFWRDFYRISAVVMGGTKVSAVTRQTAIGVQVAGDASESSRKIGTTLGYYIGGTGV
jgi:hypothetical protein